MVSIHNEGFKTDECRKQQAQHDASRQDVGCERMHIDKNLPDGRKTVHEHAIPAQKHEQKEPDAGRNAYDERRRVFLSLGLWQVIQRVEQAGIEPFTGQRFLVLVQKYFYIILLHDRWILDVRSHATCLWTGVL